MEIQRWPRGVPARGARRYRASAAGTFSGSLSAQHEEIDWALVWTQDIEQPVSESYVNLIPTTQGGTHVNGLRAGLTEALREFCVFRNLLPRGVKLAPEDVWDGVSFVFR